MFGGIVKRVREAVGAAERKPAAIPDGLRVYAIGDVHGRDDLLVNMLQRIAADAHARPPARNIIVFLGDYVDRGLQSKQVLDRLTSHPLAGFEMIYLKGNHEAAMLEFLRDANFGRTWKYYGGLETLHSYGITELTLSDNPDDFERAREHLHRVLPTAHRRFLETLQLSAEIGDYFFVHAGVAPGISLSRQVEDDLLWIRDKFLQSDMWFGKMIVHGHTPKENPVFRRNRIGIDTGAYMTNVLSCLALEGREARVIQTADVMMMASAGTAAE